MLQDHPIVTREAWLAARKALLEKEKEHTKARDQLNEQRRALPWVKVEKAYVFDTPAGKKSLGDLFDGKTQLIVNHFMLGPDWEAGCVGCSFGADHIDAALVHVQQADASFVAISRAPLPQIEAYKQRMGWRFPWVSSYDSDFNYDFHVSFRKEDLAKGKVFYNFRELDTADSAIPEELPGLSVFYRDHRGIFHTYSTYARGYEEVLTAFMILDRVPKGRNESSIMNWVKRHDEYESAQPHACCCAS
ncbi:DUF899 domain-containing protein [Rhodoligotrophos defluvii]|uniref:DUF899 domain-containing protein n=1 Tax=Rhodoligotrophos defluvii TaxID=2561934 RepID=UPI0010C9FB28|nr:thioredoxin family protein [Rhodoligotrophos defluvii]